MVVYYMFLFDKTCIMCTCFVFMYVRICEHYIVCGRNSRFWLWHAELNFHLVSFLVVIIHCASRLSTGIMDETKELIISSKMQFIVLVIAEYASSRCIREVRMYVTRVMMKWWLMEMLYRSSPVRCRRLLPMQWHVSVRLCDELRSKKYLHDHDILASKNKLQCFYLQ